MRKKTVSLTMLSLLAMLTLMFSIQPVAPQPPVVIGWAHPLTGPVAGTAAVHHLYYQMIIDDYNAKGGLAVGGGSLRTISTIVYDDEYDPVKSLELIEKLLDEDDVDLLFAPWSTAFCVAALDLFEDYKMPVIGLTVGSDTLSGLLMDLTYTYFFVTLGQPWEDALEVGALVSYINDQSDEDITKAGILYRADEHGLEHAEAIKDNLTASGITVSPYTSYDPFAAIDWEALVDSLEAATVDAAILCGYDEGSGFLRECITQDYSPKMLMVGPALETPFLVYDIFGFTPGEIAGVSYYNGFPATAFATDPLATWAYVTHVAYTSPFYPGGYLPFPASSVFYMGLESLFMAVETPGIGLNGTLIRDALNSTTFATSLGDFTFRLGQSPAVEDHGTLTQWQGGQMMDVIWPLPESPSALSTDYIIYPKFPWDYPTQCDVNKDGMIRVDDVLAAALAFGSEPGHPRWDAHADVNDDWKIRVDDILAIALEFGATAEFGGAIPLPS